jgi:hypothetical protein
MPENFFVDNLKILHHIEENHLFYISRFSCGNEVEVIANNAIICHWISVFTSSCRTPGQHYLLKHVIPHHIPRCNAVVCS